MHTFAASRPLHIEPATPADHTELAACWEASVRATHHFVAEKDLRVIGARLTSDYFPHVALYLLRRADGHIAAFAGIADHRLEMLFVHPVDMGCGLGSRLLAFATEHCGVTAVDVNEQNTRARDFYLRHGFRIVARDATDADGRPYPILHLER